MFTKIKFLLGIVYLVSNVAFAQQESTNKVKEKPKIKIGGALRFNYNLSSWKDGQKDRGGDFGYDVFRLNAKAEYKGLKMDAEYRLYGDNSGGGMLKHGWIAYDINETQNVQLGLTQVPFGVKPYFSSSWFVSMNYYVGLEEDYDMGIKYTYSDESWDFNLAFFKNAEELRFGSASDVSNSRYSYDVGSYTNEDGSVSVRNKEVNQLNTRLIYKFGKGNISHKLGISGEYGGLYNLGTMETDHHYAYAGHYEFDAGRFGFKLQAASYYYDAKDVDGKASDVLAMTAYGAPYLTAAEANVYAGSIFYTMPVEWGPISSLKFYEEYSILDKKISSMENTHMNNLGIMVTAGNIYTYIDYAMGKNQPWLGGDWTRGLSEGKANADWEARFNINIGYYF